MYFQDQLMCDIVFQATVNCGIPAQLSNKLEIKEVIKFPELKQKLPKGIFSKRALTGQEGTVLNLTISVVHNSPLPFFGLFNVLFLCFVEQKECKRKFSKQEISLKVTPLLPGLQYAIMETNRSCKGKELYPEELIQQYLKAFAHQKKMENPSKTKADLANTTYTLSRKCSQLDLSRLSSYISNPVNFSVPLQKASNILAEEPANYDNNDNLNNKDLKIPDCKTNMDFSSKSKSKTENKNPPNEKQENKTFPKSSNPVTDEKNRVRKDDEIHLPQSQASPVERTEKPYTSKYNVHFSRERKHVSSASTTTVKLAIADINRRKRGAEVLTAEFVQDVETEKTSKEVSRKSRSGDVKNTAASSNLMKPRSKTTTPVGTTDKDTALKRKTSEPAKNSKPGESSESKMKAKSSKSPVEKDCNKSMKKSIRSTEKVKKNSHKGIKSPSWSGEKPKHDNTKYGAAGKSEENIMEKRISMYESHALNLLADLALNSFSSSAGFFPNMNTASDSKNGTDNLLKALHTENRSNTDRACSPPAQPSVSLHTPATEPDQVLEVKHDEPKKDDESCHMNKSKQELNVAVAKTKNNVISKICLEHSYSQPPMNEPKVDPLTDKTSERDTRHDPTVKDSLVFDQPQNSVGLSRKNMKNSSSNLCLNLKEGPRAVIQFGDNLKITLNWDANYDFDLDSKFTSDPLEKTVNRALHGPWNLNLREKVEDVKIILHMWLALFYSKPNKALNCSSRKVVEHSNPAKFVSINTILEPIELVNITEAENTKFDLTTSVCASPSQNSKLLVLSSSQIESDYSGKFTREPFSQGYDLVKKGSSSSADSPVHSQDTDQIHINENVLRAFQKNEMKETETYKTASGAKSTCIPVLCYVRDTDQIDAESEQKEKSWSSANITGCSTEKGRTMENELLSKDIISDKEQETSRDDSSSQKDAAITLNKNTSISQEQFDPNVCSNGSENKHQLDTNFALLEQETEYMDPEFGEAEQDRPASPKKDNLCSETFETHEHSAGVKDCERRESESKSIMQSSQSLQKEVLEMCGVPQLSANDEEESSTADARFNVEYGGRDAMDSSDLTVTTLSNSHKRLETCAGNMENADDTVEFTENENDTVECTENENTTKASVTASSHEVNSPQHKTTNHNINIVCPGSALKSSVAHTANKTSCTESVKSDICEPKLLTEPESITQAKQFESLKPTTESDPIVSTPDSNLLSNSHSDSGHKVCKHRNDINTVPLQATEYFKKDQAAKLEINAIKNKVNEFDNTSQNGVETTEKSTNDAVSDKHDETKICQEQHAIDDSTQVEQCMDSSLPTEPLSLNETDCSFKIEVTEKTECTLMISNEQKSSVLRSTENNNKYLKSFSGETNKANGFMDDAKTEGMQITYEADNLNKNDSSSDVVSTSKCNRNELSTEGKQYHVIHKQDVYHLHSCLDTDISIEGQSSSTQNINDQDEKANESRSLLSLVKNVCLDHVQGFKDKETDALSEDLMASPKKENCIDMQQELNLTVKENPTAPVVCASVEMIPVLSGEEVALEKQYQDETFDCSTFLAQTESPKQGDLVLGFEEKDTVEIQEDNGLTINENTVEENFIMSRDKVIQVRQCQEASCYSSTSPPLSESHKQPVDDYWLDDSYEDVAFAQEPGNPYKRYSCHPSSDHESTKVRHTKHFKRKFDACDVPLDDDKYNSPKYFRHRDSLRQRKYENVTVSRYFLETDRTLHRKSSSTDRQEQFNIFKRRRITSDGPTQSTLDLEHLRFNHQLKGVLRNASMDADIFEPSFRTMFESKRIPCCSGLAPKIKHPLQITIQHSNQKRDHIKQGRLHNSTYSSPVIHEYELKGRSTHSSSNTKNVRECKKNTFHLHQLKYGGRLKKTVDDDISLILKECVQSTHLKLDRVTLGDPLTDRTASRNVTEACPRWTFDPDAQNSRFVKDIISDQFSKRNFHFYVNETSDDYFYSSVKNLLTQAGHTPSDPQQFCNSNEASEGMFVIIRNEDIFAHVHKIPCLLQLRLLPNVTFAGVDNPEDIMESSYQEVFHSGGFVVSDQTVIESISLDKLKDIIRLLKKMSKASCWKWLVHYRENRKLKNDKRMGSVSQMKISLLKSSQLRNMVEVLPYHLCDSKKRETSDELSCILNLQSQRIHSRLAVYLTDKPSPVREEYQHHGILVLDVDRFIRRIQKLDAQLHLS
uniref:Transcription activation suppressor family member 2 n=1 Tax=Xenopus tropicalis TaxID=8364 RepID=A0A6I8QBK1_XENTR